MSKLNFENITPDIEKKILNFINSADTYNDIIEGVVDDPRLGNNPGNVLGKIVAERILKKRNESEGKKLASISDLDDIEGFGQDKLNDLIFSFTPRQPVDRGGIKHTAIIRRSEALFRSMSTDFLLREQFITAPSEIMSEFIERKNLTPERASVSNQFLYSVMSNPGLLRWLRDYSIQLGGSQPSQERFMIDFSKAVVNNNAYHVFLAQTRSAIEKESVYGFEEVLIPVIFGIFTRGGIFDSGTYATEQSGTHMSTGYIQGGTQGIFQGGTEMSTGTYATEQSGTHMSTGYIQGGTQGIFQGGTEMSTGGGTEMSTGTGGTEMSTGNIIGLINSRFSLITLESLAQYSIQLRNSGALDYVFTGL